MDIERKLNALHIMGERNWSIENRKNHPIIYDQDGSELFLPFDKAGFTPITPGGIALKEVHDYYKQEFREYPDGKKPLPSVSGLITRERVSKDLTPVLVPSGLLTR